MMNLTNGVVELNPTLVEQQNLTQKDVDVILNLHSERVELMEKFEFSEILPQAFVKTMVLELEEIEFLLQTAWGFKEDVTKHTWWYEVAGCTCECEQQFGKEKIFASNCPIHQ